MVVSDTPPKNAFVAAARKWYNPIGFSKGYNFILWLIFDGALLGFCLARAPYMNFNGFFCSSDPIPNEHAAPGDCYWYQSFRKDNIAIIIHICTILPAGMLAVFQFVPAIRHKIILYHRIAGYLIILLVLMSNASALVVANVAMSGDAATRTMVGALVILTTVSVSLAYYNIKKLQIDQHRAWMLRAWVYFGAIITLRLIQVLSVLIAAEWEEATMHVAMQCEKIQSIFNGAIEPVYALYPACMPNSTQYTDGGFVTVTANFNNNDNPAEIAAALDSWFAAAGWLAMIIHVAAVEIYLHLTPRESLRLRQVSYERQLARGMKNAGRAGLVHDRIGDSDPWVSATEKKYLPSRDPHDDESQHRFIDSAYELERGQDTTYHH